MVFLHLLLKAIHLPMKLFHFLFQSSLVSPHGVVPGLGLLIRLLLRGDI